MSVTSRVPTLVAGGLACVPSIAWAWSAGPHALTLRGVALMAGFAAAGLFAVSMGLMLRLTWLDRVFRGLGHVYQAHHALGTAAFLMMLVHPLALALGTLLMRPVAALRMLWPNPSSQVVFSGWLALLLFMTFFIVTVTPRLRFDVWRQLHRASGLAYGAMAWHLVAAWSGSIAAGLCLGLVVAGVLCYAHRLVAQDPPWRGLRYRVVEVRHRNRHVVDLVLEPLGEKLRFEAGQFIYLALRDSPKYRACGELHPYTMTGRPEDPRLHLSIKALGDCTRHIQELTAGAEAVVQGPFGYLFPARAQTEPQLWIAGGIGVTPFLSRAASVPPGPPVDIVYAAANQGEALYLEDLRMLARDRADLRVQTFFEDTDGLPTIRAIESRTGSLEGKHVMLAGPPAMVRALRSELRARGVPSAHIHTEEGVLR